MAAKDNEMDKIGSEGGFKDLGAMATTMTKLMAKIQNMEKNMGDDDESTELMLKEMLGEVEEVTKTVQKQVASISNSIEEDPNISRDEKAKYQSLTKNIGQLTSALNSMENNPEKAEQKLNEVMGYFNKDMKSLSGDNDDMLDSDSDERITRLEGKVSRLDEKMDRLMSIVQKMSKKMKDVLEKV